jgi:predicted AAA+ superfamily ATPase
MIARRYLDEMKELLEAFPALVLTGPRQVGKTTLAKNISDMLGKPTHYLDMEKPEDHLLLASNAASYLGRFKDYCVIIDEAQVLPELFTALRPIIDEYRIPGRFVLLGSANLALVRGVSETLAGRVIYMEISQIDLLDAANAGISLEDHWFKGGFPEPLLAKNNRIWLAWTDSFMKSYVYRDINLLFGIDLAPTTIDRIWHMLAHLNGSIENAENLSRSLGISSATVKKYLDFLEGAYLIHRLPALYINNGKRLVKSAKIYLRTSGVLHYMLKVKDYIALQTHPALGASWEGYVLEQLYTMRPDRTNWYHYRTHNGAEVDMVLVHGNTPIACIEVKYTNAPVLSRGFYECIADLKTAKNFVITPSSKTWDIRDGILACSLAHFLKEELPLLG